MSACPRPARMLGVLACALAATVAAPFLLAAVLALSAASAGMLVCGLSNGEGWV